MIIDWIYGLVGGLFIGLGGLVLLIFNGRIMGASGILGQLIDGKQDTENLERISIFNWSDRCAFDNFTIFRFQHNKCDQ